MTRKHPGWIPTDVVRAALWTCGTLSFVAGMLFAWALAEGWDA